MVSFQLSEISCQLLLRNMEAREQAGRIREHSNELESSLKAPILTTGNWRLATGFSVTIKSI